MGEEGGRRDEEEAMAGESGVWRSSGEGGYNESDDEVLEPEVERDELEDEEREWD